MNSSWIRSELEQAHPIIIIPIYRLPLSQDEELSLRFCRKHLARYPHMIVGPQSLGRKKLIKYGSMVSLWEDRHFESTEAYSRLMMNADFYEEFSTWSHMLIYQLDCLVFKDELMDWCKGPWDYVGAPWFEKFGEGCSENKLWAVGNGGFSLRRIRSFLQVLRAPALENIYINPSAPPHYGILPQDMDGEVQKRGIYRKLLPISERFNFSGVRAEWTVEQEAQKYWCNEDAFWSFEAGKFFPSFRVASVREALGFAFEMNPSWCFQENNFKLPFGAHAWSRYDRDFWDGVLSSEKHMQ